MFAKWIGLFFGVSSVTQIACEQWKPYHKQSSMDFIMTHRTPNASDITATFTAVSLSQCATFCSQSPSLYYAEESGICHCNGHLDEGQEDPAAAEIKYGQRSFVYEESRYEDFVKKYVSPLKKDCLELYEDGHVTDGVYTIRPVGGASVDTWCDMTKGGWTVFQRRQDGSEDFYRGWSDYVSGFGNRTGEFWLGLDNIHLLTAEPSELNIFLDTYGDVTPTSAEEHYSTFAVSDSISQYILTEDGYTGDCVSDSLSSHSRNSKFTTYDNDNDENPNDNCARQYSGAWWYKRCHNSNLNGLYLEGTTAIYAKGMVWHNCWGLNYSVKTSIMKTKRK